MHQNPRRHSFSLVAEWMIFLFFLHQYPGGQASESSSCVSLQVKSRGQLRFESKSIDRFLRHQYPGGQALNENMERGWLLSTSLHQKLHLLEKKKNNISNAHFIAVQKIAGLKWREREQHTTDHNPIATFNLLTLWNDKMTQLIEPNPGTQALRQGRRTLKNCRAC